MRKKIVGIVVLMLVATTVVSATNIKVIETKNNSVNPQPELPSLFDWWCVDQKQTHQDGYGYTLYPPELNAQRFTPSKDKLTAVALYLFKVGTPPDPILLTIHILNNLTGVDLINKTINTSVVTIKTSGTWVLFDFEDISVTPESSYYIVCTGTAGNITNNYCWLFSGNDTYTRGDAWRKPSQSIPWGKNTQIGDFCFKTYFRKPLDVSASTNYETLVNPLTHVNVEKNSQSSLVGVDVPVWKKGDSWSFDTRILDRRYNVSGNLSFKLFLNYTETVTVTDDTGDNYTVKVTGKNVEGSLVNGSYRLKFTGLMKETGEVVFRKTNLSVYHESYTMKGLVLRLFGKIGFPLPAQLTFFQDWRTPTGYRFLPFPLIAGTNGTTPHVTQTYQEKWSLYWGFKTFLQINQTYITTSRHYHCEMANISVPAGTYNAYNISINSQYGLGHYHSWRYYVDEVGYQAKIHFSSDWDSAGRPGYSLEYNLVSTTYTP